MLKNIQANIVILLQMLEKVKEVVEKVNKFMIDKSYHFQNFYEVSNTPPELISSSIPTTFIINKRGNIIMKKKGATNWNSDFIHTFLNKHI